MQLAIIKSLLSMKIAMSIPGTSAVLLVNSYFNYQKLLKAIIVESSKEANKHSL